jgi:hydroxymethylpyrimidine pyrophosphatase-like HAD family hydrolase
MSATTTHLRVLYADLDGTLVGPGGSLFSGPDGAPSGEAAEALLRLRRAGVELVLMSGRTRRGLREVARTLGAAACIAELGGVLVLADGTEIVNLGEAPPEIRPAEELHRCGAAALLLERFAGRLEAVPGETRVSLMFRGSVDPAEVERVLHGAGLGWAAFVDNGLLRSRPPGLEVAEVHAYHLLPRGVSKATGVERHRELRGVRREETAAVGDSRADLDVRSVVGRLFLVRNGLAALGAEPPAEVEVTRGAYGAGFAEAVDALLGHRGR